MINFAYEIKQRLTMETVMRHYGFEINRQGFVCCPLHHEKTASFKVYPDDRGFSCFGCGKHGSIIDFVMEYFSLNFQQAMEKLNNDFCLGLPIGRKMTLREKRTHEREFAEKQAERERERAYHQSLIDAYNLALDEFTKADKIVNTQKPTSIDDMTVEYIEAIKALPILEERLNEAEGRLMKYESNRRNNS